MSLYECVIIARQEISAQQVEALADNFEQTIKDNGGNVAKRENWGLRSLAYKIKKNRKGNYFLFNIDAPSDAVHEMERLLRLNEDILRYMTIKVDTFEEGPSIPAQNYSRSSRATQSYNEQKSVQNTDSVEKKNAADENIETPAEKTEVAAKEEEDK
jgi:small subunit ribosomal protein S6